MHSEVINLLSRWRLVGIVIGVLTSDEINERGRRPPTYGSSAARGERGATVLGAHDYDGQTT